MCSVIDIDSQILIARFLYNPCECIRYTCRVHVNGIPDNKVRGAKTGPTWVLSATGGPHVDPMNLAIRDNTVNLFSILTTTNVIAKGPFR